MSENCSQTVALPAIFGRHELSSFLLESARLNDGQNAVVLKEIGMSQIPETGFLKLSQIIGQTAITEKQAEENRRRGKGSRRARPAIIGLIPVKKSSWWVGVKSGRFPKPVKIGNGRGTFWRVEDIFALIQTP